MQDYQYQIKQSNQGILPLKTHASSQLQQYADDTLEVQEQNIYGIDIKIKKIEYKGSGLTKYTTYFIQGQDKNGKIQVYRRFNQFWTLRNAMVQRWPGCFIPALPDKNALLRNDLSIIQFRLRFLNDFVKKISRFDYLYYSEQFQTLIRSKDEDISPIFEKWSKPTTQDIIIKYRQYFNDLAGKQINSEISNKISNFKNFLKSTQILLPSYKQMAKNLATSRNNLNNKLQKVFNRILPRYQKQCLSYLVQNKQDLLLYGNTQNGKIQQHGNIVKIISKKNPYLLIYDIIKAQQRDGEEFLQSLNCNIKIEQKIRKIEIKIKQNESQIMNIEGGKTTLKSLTSKSTKQEQKYRLKVQIEELGKQRQNLVILMDIIIGLQGYKTIQKYKESKRKCYEQSIKKITGYQINLIQNLLDIWSCCEGVSSNLILKNKQK